MSGRGLEGGRSAAQCWRIDLQCFELKHWCCRLRLTCHAVGAVRVTRAERVLSAWTAIIAEAV